MSRSTTASLKPARDSASNFATRSEARAAVSLAPISNTATLTRFVGPCARANAHSAKSRTADDRHARRNAKSVRTSIYKNGKLPLRPVDCRPDPLPQRAVQEAVLEARVDFDLFPTAYPRRVRAELLARLREVALLVNRKHVAVQIPRLQKPLVGRARSDEDEAEAAVFEIRRSEHRDPRALRGPDDRDVFGRHTGLEQTPDLPRDLRRVRLYLRVFPARLADYDEAAPPETL